MGMGSWAISMATKRRTQPKASRAVRASLKRMMPPKREKTASRLRIKLAVVGSV